MKNNKKAKIEIPQKDFIEDCIWMSYRYCIGRHTIAATMHAPQIAKFLDANPDIFSQDRKEFMAKDIRQEISDILRFRDDVYIEGFVEMGGSDAATLILQHIIDNNLDITRSWIFEVNLRTCNVNSHPSEKESPTNLLHDISDLLPWMKLANWLDPQETLTYEADEVNGIVETKPGFTFYIIGKEITAHQTTCEAYGKNPFINVYINPIYLIKQ